MLTSLQNPLVKAIRRLHQGKFRRAQGQLLLEGTHLVQEALAVGYPLQTACYTEAWAQRYPALMATLVGQVQRAELVSEGVLQAIATTQHPDGVVVVAPRRPNTVDVPIAGVGLAIATLQDPGNLGTIIRTAVAAEAGGLWLSADSVAPDHPKVLRASAGQWFRLPLVVTEDLPPLVTGWRQQGVQLVATNPRASLNYWAIDFNQPTIILLGNEGAGLPAPLQQAATVEVSIPMHPAVESLNAAISAALLLYEAKRQRQQRKLEK
ncbi:RNA methyltransferase [Nodosilinea sp. P-1105]|uniref:TrmH family RNA methyltransferase n=1 Tax=Nodosilinea sp. P-1105 TaxID=2546229 RepID=UPI00146D8EEC|nr:RNA methyltransferase [Nodosilinea sp. P-1105]NMF82891.1 RNA methyltransferase [Nodosilinea sp. P-1105]